MHILQSYRLKTPLCLGCYFAKLLLSVRIAAAEGATNTVPLPKEFLDQQTTWGEEANGLRAGVCWFEFSGKMEIRTTVLSFNTNVAWNYVTPPGKKFLKCELRDAHWRLYQTTRCYSDTLPAGTKPTNAGMPMACAIHVSYSPGIRHPCAVDSRGRHARLSSVARPP